MEEIELVIRDTNDFEIPWNEIRHECTHPIEIGASRICLIEREHLIGDVIVVRDRTFLESGCTDFAEGVFDEIALRLELPEAIAKGNEEGDNDQHTCNDAVQDIRCARNKGFESNDESEEYSYAVPGNAVPEEYPFQQHEPCSTGEPQEPLAFAPPEEGKEEQERNQEKSRSGRHVVSLGIDIHHGPPGKSDVVTPTIAESPVTIELLRRAGGLAHLGVYSELNRKRTVGSLATTGNSSADVEYRIKSIRNAQCQTGNDIAGEDVIANDPGGDGQGKTGSEDEEGCLLYTSPSPRDRTRSRMPSSA